jgi:hypothetical protein
MPYKNNAQQREYSHNHYLANKKRYLESNDRRRQLLKTFVRELKQKTPCKDCGLNYPHYVMEFDHLFDKEDLIKYFVNNNNKRGLEAELKRCEVVCSNCHRIRTHERLGK